MKGASDMSEETKELTPVEECKQCQYFMTGECTDCDHNGGAEHNYTPMPPIAGEGLPVKEWSITDELSYIAGAVEIYAEETKGLHGAEFLRIQMLANVNLLRTILTEATNLRASTKEIIESILQTVKGVIE